VVGVREVMRYPSVRWFLVAGAVATTGSMLMITALFKQAYDLTGNTLDIGIIGLAQFVPALLLVLVSGTVADRFDRRRVAAIAYGFESLLVLTLVLYTMNDGGEVWPLFLIALGIGTADAMLAPAIRSLPPLVAPPGMLPRVVALFSATWTAAAIVGPALGGFLYSIDPAVAYVVAAVMIAIAAVLTFAIKLMRQQQPSKERPTLSTAVQGLRFVWRTPIVLAAVSLDMFAVLFGGAVALIPSVAEDRLGVGDVAYGWLRAAPGIGAAAMAITLAIRPVRRRVGPTLLVVVAVFGAATVVFGVTHSYALAFLSLVVLAGADMISVFIRGSLVPLVTPNDQLGRVVAVESVFIGASNELGAFESGVAAHVLGVPLAVAGGGIATMVIAGLWAILFPTLRRVDTFEQLEEEHIGSPRVVSLPADAGG